MDRHGAVAEIRRKVLLEKASERSIMRDDRIGHEALDKILASPEPLGYRPSEPRAKPVLGRFFPVIDEILEAGKSAPPTQSHTARRIFERLRGEHGYTGGITLVKGAVAAAKRV